jgi:hypothetical protein
MPGSRGLKSEQQQVHLSVIPGSDGSLQINVFALQDAARLRQLPVLQTSIFRIE